MAAGRSSKAILGAERAAWPIAHIAKPGTCRRCQSTCERFRTTLVKHWMAAAHAAVAAAQEACETDCGRS